MSRWGWDGYGTSKRRPAKAGIKARSQRGNIGETWWSTRFVDLLHSFGMGPRLSRGKSYARSGQVMDLRVESGRVTAKVQGSRARPYDIEIRVKPLGDAAWEQVLAAMSEQALFMARLLAGEMPTDIEEAFASARVSLFPATRQDLETDCSCPDWANPCKHIAAVFFILAEGFDEDPFLIFAFRGRTKQQVVEKLRGMRSATATGEEQSALAAGIPSARPVPLADCLDNFWRSGDGLAALRVRPVAAEVPDAILRQLGPAPISLGAANLVDYLSPVYQVITQRAAELDEAESGPWIPDPSRSPGTSPAPRG